MGSLIHIAKFDILGNVVASAPGLTVYRKEYMLVLEFPNSAFLPLMVTQQGEDGFALSFNGKSLFQAAIRKSDVITAKVSYDLLSAETDVHLTFGDGSDGNRSAYVEARMDGYLVFRLGKGMMTRAFGYEDTEVLKWSLPHGVDKPEGIVASDTWCSETGGYCLGVGDNFYIVKFPNNMQFPIVEVNGQIRVVKTDLPICMSDVLHMFIKCMHYSPMFVSFRLIVSTKQEMFILDNIEYDAFGAKYDNKVLKMSEITKCLVLCGKW